MTTAGSLALVGARPLRDAFVAQRLREAGAVILGKTNLSEWANFRSTKSSSGWSGRGGQTKNPYVLERNPCGSSSGSGAAVAANLCAAAVGTETDGSVVCPWHGYEYQPATGASPAPFTEKVPTFDVLVRAGRVLVHPQPHAPGTRVEPAVLVEARTA